MLRKFLLAVVALTFMSTAAALAYDPVVDTRKIMAGTVRHIEEIRMCHGTGGQMLKQAAEP